MLIADIVRLLLTAILAALALGGHPLFWQLCVIAVPLGAFGGVFIPALLFPQILQIALLHKIARILVHPLTHSNGVPVAPIVGHQLQYTNKTLQQV